MVSIKAFLLLALTVACASTVDATFELGDACKDPYWTHKCRHIGGTCVVPKSGAGRGATKICVKLLKNRGDDCPTEFHVCPASHPDCIKPDGERARCNKKMGLGGRCETDPWWVCQDAFMCKNNVCTKTVGLGDACSARKGLLCETDLQCDGGICTKTVGLGEKCAAADGLVCESGTMCMGGICTVTVELGEQCDVAGGRKCATGQKCEGGICTKRVGLGKMCEPSKGVACANVLKCLDGKCKKLVRRTGGACPTKYHVCPAKAPDCVKPHRRLQPKCVKKMPLGKPCGQDPYWVCQDSLVCVGKVCKKQVAVNESCTAPNVVCTPPAVCVYGYCKRH